MKANESKLPLPDEVIEVEETQIMSYGNTFRYFPMSFSTLLENIADPAHVAWSHHGTTAGNRNSVKRNSGINLLHDQVDEGFAHAKIFREESTRPSGDVYFQAPTGAHLGFAIGNTGMKGFLLTWTVPIGWEKSKMFSVTAITHPPRIVRLVKRFTPRWYDHRNTDLILDGDTPLLQKQHAYLQTIQRDGYDGAWKEEYTLASGKWDNMVVKVRQFFDMYGSSMPYATPMPFHSGTERLDVRLVNDRYENHVKDCASCRPALENIKRGWIAALVGVGTTGLAALTSGIVYVTLTWAGTEFLPLPLKLIGFSGLVACTLLLCLAMVMYRFKKSLTYIDTAIHLRTQ